MAVQSLLGDSETRGRPGRDRARKDRDRPDRGGEIGRLDAPAPTIIELPPLPQRVKVRSPATFYSFLLCVALPTLLAAIYYFFIAAPQYSVEFRFAVRQASSSTSSSGSSGGLSGMLGMATPDVTDNYIVADFLTSRQAVEELSKKLDLKKLYAKPHLDWIARFDESQPIERFMPYWQRMVTASYDQITGIAIAQVRAFTAEDAYEISSALVSLSEDLINNTMLRPLKDAIKFAEMDVSRAEDRLKKVRDELIKFRSAEQQIDPQAGAVTSNVLLAQTLRANIAQFETDLAALRSQKVGPDAPMSVLLSTRIKAAKDQLAAVEGQVKTAVGGNSSLASLVGQYEQLDLEKQLAGTILQTATQNLEMAKSKAIAQHVYVETYVKPAMPQSPTYPKRIISILAAIFICLLFWTLTLLIVRSVREQLS
jgi:capsular polysaccharide transport system permease protein